MDHLKNLILNEFVFSVDMDEVEVIFSWRAFKHQVTHKVPRRAFDTVPPRYIVAVKEELLMQLFRSLNK